MRWNNIDNPRACYRLYSYVLKKIYFDKLMSESDLSYSSHMFVLYAALRTAEGTFISRLMVHCFSLSFLNSFFVSTIHYGCYSNSHKPKVVETDEATLMRRQKNIDYCKSTEAYERYITLLPKYVYISIITH